MSRATTVAALLAVCILAPRIADAQVDCSTLNNPVYFVATTDIRTVLSNIAPSLATASGQNQMDVVYKSISSCSALDYVLNDTDLDGTATYWPGTFDGNGNPDELTCTIPAGTKADLSASDVTVETCTGDGPPAGIEQRSSFVQTFLLVVPPNSSQQAITAEEAYYVFKYGAQTDKQVPPWTNPDFIFVRTPASSTQLLIGLAGGVPGTQWSSNLTNVNQGSGDIVAGVAAENTTGNAEATLGILSTQRYDKERDKLKALAFQPFGNCLGAVYPDSDASSFDKQNVRDGHYPIWANLQFVGNASQAGTFDSPDGQRLYDVIEGNVEVPGLNVPEAIATSGAVPVCAMEVERDYDMGPLRRFQHPSPCGCFFEEASNGSTSCATCTDETDCDSGQICNFGYCEEVQQ